MFVVDVYNRNVGKNENLCHSGGIRKGRIQRLQRSSEPEAGAARKKLRKEEGVTTDSMIIAPPPGKPREKN